MGFGFVAKRVFFLVSNIAALFLFAAAIFLLLNFFISPSPVYILTLFIRIYFLGCFFELFGRLKLGVLHPPTTPGTSISSLLDDSCTIVALFRIRAFNCFGLLSDCGLLVNFGLSRATFFCVNNCLSLLWRDGYSVASLSKDFLFFFLYALSNFDPCTHSLNKTVESTSSLKSAGISTICGSASEKNFLTKALFGIIGFRLMCRSNAVIPSDPISVLSADKILDLSLVKSMSLSVLNRSFIVLIIFLTNLIENMLTTFSTISWWMRGQHTSAASRSSASLPACPKCIAEHVFSNIPLYTHFFIHK